MSHKKAKRIRKALGFNKSEADSQKKRLYRVVKNQLKSEPIGITEYFCRMVQKEMFRKQLEESQKNTKSTLDILGN